MGNKEETLHIEDIVGALIKLGDSLLDEGGSVISGETFEFSRGKIFY